MPDSVYTHGYLYEEYYILFTKIVTDIEFDLMFVYGHEGMQNLLDHICISVRSLKKFRL